MRAGKLRHRITLLCGVKVQNRTGEDITEWQPVTTRRASVIAISGSESDGDQGTGASIVYDVLLRYLEGVIVRVVGGGSGRRCGAGRVWLFAGFRFAGFLFTG